jgi:tRNA nucleotidyltransferase (CCA-adding enzyme)
MSDAAALPRDAEEARARLSRAPIPPHILEVARVLQRAGHAAVMVGGAVRDVLLGLSAADWDLASSALPEEVQAAFKRTIPTGIEHGTVTVLVRDPKGGPAIAVEVTTFRGEGAYTDGRRPSEVTFHRDLVEDLARRDFTVNAFAWDPIGEVFSDPFDGLGDLRHGLIRAVGDPARRFGEDGLRTMRAVRLCATRELALEPATAAAIPGALDVLAKVSRERVHVELTKLLASAVPSRGLVPMASTGIWPLVLPVLAPAEHDDAVRAVDALPPDAVLRIARLLWPVASDEAVVQGCLDGLRHGRAERTRLAAVLGSGMHALARAADALAIRRACATIGRPDVEDALAILAVDRRRVDDALRGAALAQSELAIKGRDLIEQGIAQPGKQLGELLAKLFEATLVDPDLNDRDRLLALARGG